MKDKKITTETVKSDHLLERAYFIIRNGRLHEPVTFGELAHVIEYLMHRFERNPMSHDEFLQVHELRRKVAQWPK